jgi:hypothetical protein
MDCHSLHCSGDVYEEHALEKLAAGGTFNAVKLLPRSDMSGKRGPEKLKLPKSDVCVFYNVDDLEDVVRDGTPFSVRLGDAGSGSDGATAGSAPVAGTTAPQAGAGASQPGTPAAGQPPAAAKRGPGRPAADADSVVRKQFMERIDQYALLVDFNPWRQIGNKATPPDEPTPPS